MSALNFAHLRSFVEVAKTGNFTIAARNLRLTQPCISFHIKRLEETLGVKLFIRQTRQIELTVAAHLVLSYAEAIFNVADHLREEIQNLSSQQTSALNIGSGPFFAEHYLPEILASFKRQFPAINIRCEVKPTRALFTKVNNLAYDFAFLGEVAADENLKVEDVAQDEVVVIVSATHPLGAKSSISVGELADWPIIGYVEESETQAIVDDLFSREKVTPPPFLRFASSEPVKRAVEAGVGVALFPRKPAARELKEGSLKALSLKALSLKGRALCRRYTFVYRKDNPMSSSAKAFRDAVLRWKSRRREQAEA